MVVIKIRVSVSSLSKVQLHHPWQESIFVICKNAYTLFAHPVQCSEGPQEIHILCYYCFTLDFATPGEQVSQG